MTHRCWRGIGHTAGRLIAIGIKQSDAQDLYATTDEGQVRAALDHTEERMRKSSLPKLDAPAAYFRDALKKGYAKLQKNDPVRATGLAAPAV